MRQNSTGGDFILKTCLFCVTLILLMPPSKTNTVYFSQTPVLRDDNLNTCSVFHSAMSAPWEIDILLPVSYYSKSASLTVELFGENIGCSSGDDGKLYLFPISLLSNVSGVIPRTKTCVFVETSVVSTTGQQKCAYNCSFPADCVALRVIRLPNNRLHTTWKLCEVTKLFYENLNCRVVWNDGITRGYPVDQRDCWIAAGRMEPTGFGFAIGKFLYDFEIYYGNSSCRFKPQNQEAITKSIYFEPGETITQLNYYRDIDNLYTEENNIVGMNFSTNIGKIYGVFGKIARMSYMGKMHDLLYFLGRADKYIDVLSVQLGKC